MPGLISRLSGTRTKLLRRTSEQSANSAGSQTPVEPPNRTRTVPPTPAEDSTFTGTTPSKLVQVPAAGNGSPPSLSDRRPNAPENPFSEDLQWPLQQRKSIANQALPPTVTVQKPTPDEGAAESPQVLKQLIPLPNISQSPPTPESLPESPPGTGQTATNVAQEGSKPARTDLQSRPVRDIQQITQQPADEQGYFGEAVHAQNMSRRKIWVKRPGASATLVQISEMDLVDDARDQILRKYTNSLGRSFDSPDVTLRIVPREETQRTTDRTLGPEESICKILETYFPGGQKVEEALIIDVPQKRTPRPSPRVANHMTHYFEDHRPVEQGNDYFPPMPLPSAVSPGPISVGSQHSSGSYHPTPVGHQHAIAILETGQLPALPSPRDRKLHHRPKNPRQHTSSPTIMTTTSPMQITMPHHTPRQSRVRNESVTSDSKHANGMPVPPPPFPSPPPTEPISASIVKEISRPSSPRLSSPRPQRNRKLRNSKQLSGTGPTGLKSPPPAGLVDDSVPPINVLIVEDNPINLRLLEAFVKRLKVRWQTAMNGRDAVAKWRAGGFHLVLMDIQLPIMSGLEATKEIRRLERVNGIGVFARSEGEERSLTLQPNGDAAAAAAAAAAEAGAAPRTDADKLQYDSMLKSPVIIVALTASSLQSDRHEALAAGCNDFLTKPVSFPWLERKVMEWGCMQALIDFDGWRKWKDFAADKASGEDAGTPTGKKVATPVVAA